MANIFLISSKLPPEYSGSGNRVFRTALNLEKKYGYNYSMICSSTIKKNVLKYYKYKNKIIYLISKKFFSISQSDNKILNFIKFRINFILEFYYIFTYLFKNRKTIDLLHIVGNVNITNASIIFGKVFNKPIFLEIVNDIDSFNFYTPLIFKLYSDKKLKNKIKIIVISKKLEKVFIKHGYCNEQIWHKPNPVKKIFFLINEKKKTNKIFILHLAKFIPRKKQDFMIKVMKFLPDKYHLNLVGPFENEGIHYHRDSKYLKKLKKNILDYGLSERVKIINNYVDNPEKYLELSDIFVLPSINEGLGTTLLEAVAARRPIVCNNLHDVFGQYVENSKNGFLVDLNPKLWARKIMDCELLDNKELKIAREKIFRCASEDLIISKYNNEIIKILKNENSNS